MARILIAEDDKFLASAYRLKLTKEGYEVQIARDGQETLDALPSFHPDLLILDLIMPVKDGFAALQEIRANPTYAKLPIIVASNLGQKEDFDKAKALGANEFIVKSDLAMATLLLKIKAFLSKQPSPPSVPPPPTAQS